MAKKPKEELYVKHRPKPLPVRYTPNVTPLIDVMFLLLLFFLLTTKFRQEEGAIPGTLPALGKSIGGATADEQLTPINVSVFPNPAVEGNMDALYEITGITVRVSNADTLYERLKARAESFGPKVVEKQPVVIKARSDVRWGFVVEAFNQALRAGFRTILFAPVGS